MNANAELSKPGKYKIKVIRTIGDIEEIRSQWEEGQYYPDADIDLFIAYCNAKKEAITPHIIVLMSEENPEAMMIGRIEDSNLNFKFGYKVIFSLKVRSLNILYGGTIGNLSDDVYGIFFEEILTALRKGEADIAFLNHQKSDSLLYNLALKRPHAIFRDHYPTLNPHWKTVLPESFDEFVRTRPKNFRNNLKKYGKKVRDQYGDAQSVVCYQKKNDFDRLINDIETIASKTYHRGMGVGFINDEVMRNRTLLALERNAFRAYVMYLNQIPCAFVTGVKYGDSFFPWATGYDPVYNQYSPGTLIIMEMVKALCGEGDIRAIDFGFGEAYYKHNFCNENWQESSIYIYAPTFKGALINVCQSLLTSTSGFTERILNRLNLINRVKKIWRDRLAQGKKNIDENPG